MITNGNFDHYQKYFMELKSADFRLESTDCQTKLGAMPLYLL